MSFILDALKKSESERQRQNAPGIADVPQATGPQPVPRWIWVLGALLLVNTVVLIGVFLRPDVPIPAVHSTLPQEPVARQNDSAAARPARFSEIVAEAKRSRASSAGSPTEQVPATAPPAVTVVDPVAPAKAAPQSTVRDGMRSFNDLRAAGVLQLPDLHLDIHVYAQQPADRFVFVNMSKYLEGAMLVEGPLVKEITPDGVVLEQSGTNFLLPRQ
jgi:general secretion pathway protein B